jgi:hypothetical protein
MIDFDPIKAAREELAGLNSVEDAIRSRERACEMAISEAERELNAIRKIRGFLRINIEAAKEKLAKLEQDR